MTTNKCTNKTRMITIKLSPATHKHALHVHVITGTYSACTLSINSVNYWRATTTPLRFVKPACIVLGLYPGLFICVVVEKRPGIDCNAHVQSMKPVSPIAQ